MKKLLLLIILGNVLFQLSASDSELGTEAVSREEVREKFRGDDRIAGRDFDIIYNLIHATKDPLRRRLAGKSYVVWANRSAKDRLTTRKNYIAWADRSPKNRLNVLSDKRLRLVECLRELRGSGEVQLYEDMMKPSLVSFASSAFVLFWQDKGINLLSRWYNSWRKPKNELQGLQRKYKREQIKKIAALVTATGTGGFLGYNMNKKNGNSAKRQTIRFISTLVTSLLTALPDILRLDKKQQLIEQQIQALQAAQQPAPAA